MKYPLDEKEWKWTNGGTVTYDFENIKNGEKHTIELEDKIEVSLATLYSLVEDIDHTGILDGLEEKTDSEEFDLKRVKEGVESIRDAIRLKWKKKFTGDLPHL